MNTSQIKNFAQQARNILKKGVYTRLLMHGYDPKTKQIEGEIQEITGGFIINDQIRDPLYAKQWQSLNKAIKTHGVDNVAEEAAYTWFNRLMAIRILVKNGYIPPQLEYVSDTLQTTVIVDNARQGFYARMDEANQARLEKLLQNDSQETELFTLLISHYCRTNELLNRLFGRINDYTELLLPADILSENGFIRLLNTTNTISDEDYQQVELIGWLYQFYISEKKDDVFASFKKNKKAEAEDIPAATQIFTPNWIVKYMVENTVGQLWLDLNPRDNLRDEMRYRVENPDAHSAPIISEVADIQLLDPAAGSGHILVEGFDLLYRMYRKEGYTAREAAESILRQNLYGLDIDLRAVQLARFALLLKAAKYSPEILQTDILPHIYAMPEADEFTPEEVSLFLGDEGKAYQAELAAALTLMQQAKNLGSVMKLTLTPVAREFIQKRVAEPPASQDIFTEQLWERLKPFIDILLVLTRQYNAVAANPPYMGGTNMNNELKTYINKKYPLGKSDLATVFIQFFKDITTKNGYYSFITPPSWMFLSTYEKLRKEIIEETSIQSLLHLSRGIFGADFGSVSTVIKNKFMKDSKGVYFRLVERTFQEFEQDHLRILFLKAKENPKFKYLFAPYSKEDTEFNHNENGALIYYPHILQSNFEKIPGSPIAYWVSERVVNCYLNEKLSDYMQSAGRIKTHNNDKYIRLFWEVSSKKIGREKHWIFIENGGEVKKWFGNRYEVLNWTLEARNNYQSHGGLSNSIFWNKKGITWSIISSGLISFRIKNNETEYTSAAPVIMPLNKNDIEISYFLAFLNSTIAFKLLKMSNPTINTTVGDVCSLPIKFGSIDLINRTSANNISLSKTDWDSRETSWDFQANPLMAQQAASIEEAYKLWCEAVTKDFFTLHQNEEELNRIFIEIYGLQEELTPEVALRDITILQEEIKNEDLDAVEPEFRAGGNQSVTLPIQRKVVATQLVSYLVGVAMGRYRLDKPGLHIAHPSSAAEETAAYSYNGGTFCMEEDAVMPLMPEDCGFADNTLVRVKELLSLIWGEEQLINTLNFLNDALGKSLEDYLRDDFWADHVKRYQKRPIYWLFSSKKSGRGKPAFQVLAYMHRMNRHTAETVRSRYLIRYIATLNSQITALKERDAELNNQERRLLVKLESDLYECREYEIELKTIADQQIEFDLDDGVKVNYAKFGDVLRGI